MKTLPVLVAALGLALIGTGCTHLYNVTMNNGQVITSRGKPHYDKENGVLVFTDVRGQERHVPAGSVSSVGPASDKTDTKGFNPKLSR